MDEAKVESEIAELWKRMTALEATVAAISENLGNAGHPVVMAQPVAVEPEELPQGQAENI